MATNALCGAAVTSSRVPRWLADGQVTKMQPTATTIRNHASFLMEVCNETAKAEQLLTRADFVEEANTRTRVRWLALRCVRHARGGDR